MTILFVGSEIEAFNIGGDAPTIVTSGSTFDSTYQRSSIRVPRNYANYIQANFAAVDELWFHATVTTFGYSSSGFVAFEFLDASDTPLFHIYKPSTSLLAQAQYWNGSAMVDIGTTFALTASRTIWDIHLVGGVSGLFEVFCDGVLLMSGSADMSLVSDIDRVKLRCVTSSSSSTNHTSYSEVVVADERTLGVHVFTDPPTANGANTAWSNDYTAVDENSLDDADFIAGANADDVETFTGAGRTIPVGYEVIAVAVTARARRGETGPQNIQPVLRKDGVNYAGSNMPIGTGFAPAIGIFETDPSTSAAWDSSAGSSGLEFGVKAVA